MEEKLLTKSGEANQEDSLNQTKIHFCTKIIEKSPQLKFQFSNLDWCMFLNYSVA